MPDGVYRRSRTVQEQMTAKEEHRSAGPVDLPVAAAAEEAELTPIKVRVRPDLTPPQRHERSPFYLP